MINKRKAKGSMVAQGTKKKNKMGKAKSVKKTMFSKEEGSIFKKSAKKVKSSPRVNSGKTTTFSKEKASSFKKSAKNAKSSTENNHHSLEQLEAKPKKQKNYVSTNGNTTMEKRKKKKNRTETDSTKAMEVGKRPKEETVPMSNTTGSGAATKKKKKRKLAGGAATGPVAGGNSPAAGGAGDPAAGGAGDPTAGGAGDPAAGGAGDPAAGGAGDPARLSVTGGFSWETAPWPEVGLRAERADDSSSDDADDSQQQPAAKLSRQQLRQRAVAEELQLVQRERRLMDPSRAPETADDHERLVVAHPDDSSLWIHFMSYFLQATEIEKARGVARRALKTINFREEDEKLNVYVAWLNLESMHGTQETLSNVLHEALQSNDKFKVYTRMAEIHQANSKHDEAELMYSQLVKKMAGSKEAWLRYGVFLMQVERRDAARGLMQRALRCLDRRDHVEVISKFAQLEFRFGEPERGKTMFDHLLSTYPKRLDQWNVYVSQLIKSGDYDSARRIFQRAATVRLSARRVRSLLKRFLEFEEAHGTADQQEAVRQMARQYVETRSEADAALLDTGR